MINPLETVSPLTPKQVEARERTLDWLLQEVDKAPKHRQPELWKAIETHERVISQGHVAHFQGSFI